MSDEEVIEDGVVGTDQDFGDLRLRKLGWNCDTTRWPYLVPNGIHPDICRIDCQMAGNKDTEDRDIDGGNEADCYNPDFLQQHLVYCNDCYAIDDDLENELDLDDPEDNLRGVSEKAIAG